MPIVYTGGTFDMIHIGHVELLTECSKIAGPNGRVIVALNTDEFVGDFKGSKPIQPFAERREMLMALTVVDAVLVNVGGKDSKQAIEVVRPDVIAIGDDWKDKDYHSQMGFTQDWLDERGIELVYIARTTGQSTSRMKQMVKEMEWTSSLHG